MYTVTPNPPSNVYSQQRCVHARWLRKELKRVKKVLGVNQLNNKILLTLFEKFQSIWLAILVTAILTSKIVFYFT